MSFHNSIGQKRNLDAGDFPARGPGNGVSEVERLNDASIRHVRLPQLRRASGEDGATDERGGGGTRVAGLRRGGGRS